MKRNRNIGKRVLAAVTAALILVTGMPAEVHAATAELVDDIEQTDIMGIAGDIAEDVAKKVADSYEAALKAREYDEVTAEAVEHDRPFYELQFEKTGDSYKVSKLVMKSGVATEDNLFYGFVEIPDEYEGLPVTSIGSSAFSALNSLSYMNESYAYIMMPATVKSFEERAFSDLRCYVTFDFEENSQLTTIGDYAFWNSGVGDLNFLSNVTSIGNYAFSNSRIGYVSDETVFPASLTSIGDYAFEKCEGLRKVSFEENSALESIGEYAFSETRDLSEFNYPTSAPISRIESGTFEKSGISAISFQPGSKINYVGRYAFSNSSISEIYFDSHDNSGLDIEEEAFSGCLGLSYVQLPDTVRKLGTNAFANTYLKKVESYSEAYCDQKNCEDHDHSHVIRIEELAQSALSDTSIEKLKIGLSSSFYEKSPLPYSLKELVYDGNEIPACLCLGLGNLEKVTFLSTIDWVGDSAFGDCVSLSELEFPEEGQDMYIGAGSFSGCSSLEEINLPEGIYHIGESAFNGCKKLGLPELPDGVRYIGSEAFKDTLDFSLNKLPSKLETVGDRVFEGCAALMYTPLPDNIKSVGEEAFADIPYQELVIPASLTEIGSKAFSGAKKIVFADGTRKIPDNVCSEYEALKEVLIPDSVTTIGEYAFNACKNLATINLPDSITTIEKYAFKGCISISSLKIPSKVTSLGIYAFADCKQLTKITFPTGMGTISGGAFSGCESLKSIKLPNGVVSIEAFAFMNCKNLTSIKFSNKLERIGHGAFVGCTSLSDIALPESLTTIAGGAFSNTDIYVVEIPKNVKGVPSESGTYITPFSTVRRMIFADGTTTIPSAIGYIASDLEEIVVPKSVTSIGRYAFYACHNITDIYYEGTEEEWKNVAQGNNDMFLSKATVHYGSGSTGNDPVTGVVIKPGAIIITLSETKKLCAEVLPKTAGNKYVSWTTLDPSIADVDKNGVVTPKKYGKTKIAAVTNEGEFSAFCDVTVTNNVPVFSGFKLEGGGGDFKVRDDVPFFGGKEFSLDLPVDLPINFVLEDNKIKIGINIKKENLYSYNSTEGVTTTTYKRKPIKDQFEEFLWDVKMAGFLARDKDWMKTVQDQSFIDAHFPAFEESVSFGVVGYLEGAWTGEWKPQMIQGTVVFTVSGSQTATHIFTVTVPITVMCTLSASGQFTADVGYNFDEAKIYVDTELALSVGIELYGGVGVGDWISVGVYGKASTNMKVALHINVLSDVKGLQEWTLSGEAGIKAYFAKKSASFPLISGTFYIIPEEKNQKSVAGYDRLEPTDAAIDHSLIVKNLAATESILNNTAGVNGILVENAYNAAKPVMASTSTDQLLFYVTDNTSRSLLNQSQLVYSIYDPVKNTYSDAKPVLAGNTTADYEPEVFSDGSDIYVAWLDSDKLFTDEDAHKDDADSLDAYVKSFRVHVAKYNSADNSFEDLGGPSESKKFTSSPRLFMKNGKLQLAFVENKNDSMVSGTDSLTSVYWAEYSDGKWNIKDEVSGLNSVSSIAFAEEGNDVYLGYVVEKDTDPKTEGQELFIRKNSVSNKVAVGAFTNLSYTELPGVGGKVMAVNARGALEYLDGGNLTQLLPTGTMNASSRYYTVGNKVLYIVSGEESRSIAASTYDNGEWGQGLLTHEEKSSYIDFMSVDSGTICYLYSDVVPAGDGTFDATSSIRIMTTGDYYDTELELADFVVDEAYPGATLPVSLYVRNNGTAKVEKAHVSVAYGETELASSDIDVSIMPGETKDYPFEFVVPQSLSYGGDIEVTVSTTGDEEDSNDTKQISLSMADLEVMSSYDDSGEIPIITILVENNGLRPTDMKLVVKDEDDRTLFTEKGKVMGGDFVKFEEEYTLDKKQVLTISVVADENEYYTMNNITWLEVGKDKFDPDPDPEIEEAFSVKFAETADDPYDGLFLNTESGAQGRYETVYTGAAIKPAVTVYGYNKKLTEGIDYTVKYSNNTAVSKGKTATVTITGKGNFAGKKTLEFYILPADLGKLNSRDELTVPNEIKLQSGKKISPVIIYGDYTLKASDITLSNTGVIKENTTIDITGKGNFTGSITGIPVTVLDAKAVKEATIKVKVKAGKHAYDGTPKELSCTYLDDKGELVQGEITVTAGSSKNPLTKNKDYKVIYKPWSNIQAGKVKFTVIGIGDYTGSVSKTFTITPDKTGAITATLADADADIMYTPGGVSPKVNVTVARAGQELLNLAEGTDYKIVYSNNKKVGTGKFTVNFLGNYKGHPAIKNQTFTIKQAPFTSAKAVSADMVYNKPGKYLSKPMVSIDNVLLTAKDYEVTYFDGETELTSKSKFTLDDGVASKVITVNVKGKGNFLGDEVVSTYRVIMPAAEKANLSKAKIVAKDKVNGKDVAVGKQDYTGAQVRPEIRVLVKNGAAWSEVADTSYTVEYVNNVKTGSATILITGNGDGTYGSKSCKFKIGTRSFNIFSILFGRQKN